jgi:hypothetical protein
LSGNPSDHLVHRHTHRVVRGTLAIFGRPDGRLSALSTAEASVCLSVNQASSIQSWGGTCESITIGHNPFKLDLTKNGIFLKRHRPLFFCERLLVETDAKQEKSIIARRGSLSVQEENASLERPLEWRTSPVRSVRTLFSKSSATDQSLHHSLHRAIDCSVSLARPKGRSAPALLGAYLNIEENSSPLLPDEEQNEETNLGEEMISVEDVVAEAISGRKWSSKLRHLFQTMDADKDGVLSKGEFIAGVVKLNPQISNDEAEVMFRGADVDGNLSISIDEFLKYLEESGFEAALKAPPSHRDARGIIQVEMAREKYFGEDLRKLNAAARNGKEVDFLLVRNQHLCQELYESRIASLQRFVSMTVLFHQMGKRVENFFSRISFGVWSYRFDRTHSIMRIATTASPVSGADVRQRMEHLRLLKKIEKSLDTISSAYLAYRQRKKETEGTRMIISAQ